MLILHPALHSGFQPVTVTNSESGALFLRKNILKIIGKASFLRKNMVKVIGEISFLRKNIMKIVGDGPFLHKNRVKIIGNVSFLRKNGRLLRKRYKKNRQCFTTDESVQ